MASNTFVVAADPDLWELAPAPSARQRNQAPAPRAQVGWIGGGVGRDEGTLAVPHFEPPIEAELELDPGAGAAAPNL